MMQYPLPAIHYPLTALTNAPAGRALTLPQVGFAAAQLHSSCPCTNAPSSGVCSCIVAQLLQLLPDITPASFLSLHTITPQHKQNTGNKAVNIWAGTVQEKAVTLSGAQEEQVTEVT